MASAALDDLIQGYDWSATPLGGSERWPLALRATVELVLASPSPMVILWGPDLITIHNEAYRALLGSKPDVIGRPFSEVWPEVYPQLAPALERAFAGHAAAFEDAPFTLQRRGGAAEEAYFSFSLSPVRDDTAAVAGVLNIVVETTARVLAERRVAFRLELEHELRKASSPDSVMMAAVTMLGEHLNANRVGYGEVLPDDETVRLSHCCTRDVAPLLGDFPLESFGPESIAKQRRGEVEVCPDVLSDPELDPAVWASISTRAFVSAPLLRGGRLVASLYVNSLEPRHWSENDKILIEEVAARTWDAVERVRAEAGLRESESRFRLMADSVPQIVWITDADGRLQFFNKQWSDYIGAAPPDTAEEVAAALIHPDDAAATISAFAKARQTGAVYEVEHRIRSAAGDYRWFLVRAEPHRDRESGEVVGWYGSSTDIHDHKLAADALRESEARLRLVQASGGIGTFDYDLQSDHAICSPEYYAMLGLPDGAPINRETWRAAIFPEDRARAAEALQRAIEDAQPFDHEYRIVRADTGEIRWLAGRAGVIRDAEGRPWRYVGGNVDITDRRRAEERTRESEQQLRLATEAAEVGLWDLDVLTDTLYWPPRVKAMFGISPDRPISMADYYAGLHPDDHDHTSAAFAEALDPQERALYDVEYRTVGKEDGVCRWVAAKGRGIFDDSGRCVRVLGTAIDISERKRTETELRRLNETLEQRVSDALADRKLWADVFESTDAMIAALAPDHRFLAVNKAYADEFERIFGVRPAKGDDLGELLASQPEHQAIALEIWDRALTGEEFVIVEDFGDPERDRPYYEARFNRLRDRHGSPMGAFQYAVDVSERLRAQARLAAAEEQLRQSQKLEAIGQLTGGVAHDFNNLLTVIRGSVELLRRPSVSEERRARYVDAIGETADRAAKLTGQLLAFARRQALRPEVFDPRASIQALAVVLRTLTGSRVTIETRLGDLPCWVDADPGQFDTALINMAVNARDAMGAEGVLTITVEPVSRIPAVRGQAAAKGEFVAVSVADTGEGIPADRVERIFEPFFTTKPVGQGTGLGLSQVFGFAKQSGGEVEVRSAPGEGATFVLYLPRATAPARQASENTDEMRTDGRGACVLVVEDNREVGEFATQALAELGYQSVWAANGDAALAELETDPTRFDIVFSDVVMPGMNGVQLGQEIRRLYQELPVLLASGYSHILAEHGDHGFELLHKPYSIEELSRVMRTAMGRRTRATTKS